MIRKKIIAIIILLHIMLPMFFITPLIFSQSPKFPPGSLETSDPIIFNSESVNSPYYEEYESEYDWVFDPSYAPLQILTIVHQDQNSYFDDFSYLSAIPIAIFNDSGVKKISPVLYDTNIIEDTNMMDFLIQWKKYNDYFGGLKRVIYIGDVNDQVRNKITEIFGAPSIYRLPLNFTADNVFDLSAGIASYFWYENDKVVISKAQNTIAEFENSADLPSIIDTVNMKQAENIIGNLNSTLFSQYYDSNNITVNGGAIKVEINDTRIELQLIGNFSTPSDQWIFDTTNFTDNNWVFFPNVTHPADLSDWGVHLFNNTQITSDIYYNLTFYNYTSNYHNFRINYSNCEYRIGINSSDTEILLINPDGQFFTASNSTGQITLRYPSLGDWTMIISGNETHNIPYEISINMANYSLEKETLIESASNGAIIASLLHAPLLYTDGNSLTDSVRQELNKLDPTEAIIVDPDNSINETLITELGISVNSLENMSIIMDYIDNASSEKDIILTSLKDGFFAPSTLIAAYHGGTVLPVFNNSYNFYGKAMQNYKLLEYSIY